MSAARPRAVGEPPASRPVPRVTSFLTALLAFSAVNAPTVLYSAWREEMGFAATVQTLVYAVYVAGLIPGLILTGAWLRRFSPRALLVVATGVSVLAALGLAVAAGPALLLVARAVQGLALGVVMTASSAALYQAMPPRPRAVTALLVTLTAILGACLGPVLAGVLADLTGTTAAPMTGAAIALVATLVLLGVHGAGPRPESTPPPGPAPSVEATSPTPPATPDASLPAASTSGSVPTVDAGTPAASTTPAEPAASPGPDEPPLTPRSHLMISLTAGTSWSMVGLYQSVGPGLIGTALGVDSLTALGGIVAIVLGVAGVVQVASQGLAVPRARRLGLAFLVFGIVGFAAMLVTGQVWLALVAAVGAGVGHGFTYLSATQEMGELIRRHPAKAGPLLSRYFAMAYLCLAVFTVTLGVVGDFWALTPAALILLGVLAAASVAMLFSRNGTERPAGHLGVS